MGKIYNKRRRPKFKAIFLIALGVIVALSFLGVQPLADYKDAVIARVQNTIGTGYDVELLPGESATYDGWLVALNSGGWKGGMLKVQLAITNTYNYRRKLGHTLMGRSLLLTAIDSTGKIVEPESSGLFHPCEREFYPKETWVGEFTFELSPYSGRTGLYMTEFYNSRKYYLFGLGEPKE